MRLFLRNVGLPMAIWYIAWLALAIAIAVATPLNVLWGMGIGEVVTGIGIVIYLLRRRHHG